MNLLSIKSLGVINRTPNSFSDHGLSLNQAYFETQLKTFLSDPTCIVDIGFESTAPMNAPITHEEEKKRFNDFLVASKDFSFEDKWISLDTYKIESFLYMETVFKKLHPKAAFIFNDVSGVLDKELKKAIIPFKAKDFYYIYTFSHIPERSQVLDHMKYLDEKNVIDGCVAAFKLAFEWFRDLGMEGQLILDPGFGFSKSYDQNWDLVNDFKSVSEGLVDLGIHCPILIGLSKKSFLKKALNVRAGDETEELHKDCIQKIRVASKHTLLFRVHNPEILS